MGVLWAADKAVSLTANDVARALPGRAYTTIATVLNRLAHKGFVRRASEPGRTVIHYTAVATDATHTAETMRRVLLSASEPAAALAHFAETADTDELRILQQALDRRRDTTG